MFVFHREFQWNTFMLCGCNVTQYGNVQGVWILLQAGVIRECTDSPDFPWTRRQELVHSGLVGCFSLKCGSSTYSVFVMHQLPGHRFSCCYFWLSPSLGTPVPAHRSCQFGVSLTQLSIHHALVLIKLSSSSHICCSFHTRVLKIIVDLLLYINTTSWHMPL